MKTYNIILFSLMSLLLMSLLISWKSINTVQEAETVQLTAIVNTFQDEVSSREFVTIMRGEKQRWSDGNKVVLALMKTTTKTGEAASAKVYKMSTNQFNKYWLAQVFQGRVQSPHFFTSEPELIDFVNSTAGAIGIVKEIGDKNVKVLKVEGKTKL